MEEKKTNIVKVGHHEFYMDGYCKSNLDRVKEVVKKDWDFVFIVDGMEGGGKSTLAIQIALYLDPTLTLERIVFTADDFEKQILRAEKYQAIVYDEAITGLYSREAMQYINTTLTKLLAQIRQKNLFVFIIMPTFFDLDKYVSMWRGRGLFHVYTKNFERGYFLFYNHEKKKSLYVYGKKYYSYKKGWHSFKGRFYKFNPFEKEYRAKKMKVLNEREGQEINPMYQRDKLIVYMWSELGLSQRDIARAARLSKSTIQFVCSKSGKLYDTSKKHQSTGRT